MTKKNMPLQLQVERMRRLFVNRPGWPNPINDDAIISLFFSSFLSFLSLLADDLVMSPRNFLSLNLPTIYFPFVSKFHSLSIGVIVGVPVAVSRVQ